MPLLPPLPLLPLTPATAALPPRWGGATELAAGEGGSEPSRRDDCAVRLCPPPALALPPRPPCSPPRAVMPDREALPLVLVRLTKEAGEAASPRPLPLPLPCGPLRLLCPPWVRSRSRVGGSPSGEDTGSVVEGEGASW